MTEKQDEQMFKNAHEENVSFRSFDETRKNADSYKASNFSLIQQLSQKSDYISTTDLNGNSVEGHISTTVKDLLTSQNSSENNQIKTLESVAKINKNSNSIRNFLQVDSTVQSRSERLNSYDFSSNDISIHDAPTQNTIQKSEAQNFSNNANRYEQLLDASTKGVYSNNSQKDDDLQNIYKRLLKCQ